MKISPLPFFDERSTPIDTLIFHCSAQSAQAMIQILQQEKLSCHYIIDLDGSIIQVVPEEKRAWHGGIGHWREIETDINSHSIGIELSSLSLGQTPYSQAQIDSLIKLSADIINRHHIKSQYIIGHSDSAPTRKADPGKAFPWSYLAQNGIGLWYDIKDASDAPTNNLRELLSGIGYNTQTPEAFSAAQYAFARHFLPDLITSENDIRYLVENVFPQNTDFSSNDQFITTAQAVYMRFKP